MPLHAAFLSPSSAPYVPLGHATAVALALRSGHQCPTAHLKHAGMAEFAYVPAVQFEHTVPFRPFVDVPSRHAVQSGLDALSALASVAQPPPLDVRPAAQFAHTGPLQSRPLQPYCPAAQNSRHGAAEAVAKAELVGDGANELEPDADAVEGSDAEGVVVFFDMVGEGVSVGVGEGVDEIDMVDDGVGLAVGLATTTAAASSSARSAPVARGAAWRDIGDGLVRVKYHAGCSLFLTAGCSKARRSGGAVPPCAAADAPPPAPR